MSRIKSKASILGHSLAQKQEELHTKAFTKWANAYLKDKGIQINDITKDLKNGLNLCHLLSALTGEHVKPPNGAKSVQSFVVKAKNMYIPNQHSQII